MIQATAWSTYAHFLFFDKDYREPELATCIRCGMFSGLIQGQMFLEVKTATINEVTSCNVAQDLMLSYVKIEVYHVDMSSPNPLWIMPLVFLNGVFSMCLFQTNFHLSLNYIFLNINQSIYVICIKALKHDNKENTCESTTQSNNDITNIIYIFFFYQALPHLIQNTNCLSVVISSLTHRILKYALYSFQIFGYVPVSSIIDF